MKNFLTKKATMIGSIVAAAFVLVLLIAFCARPVAVGYSYTYKDEMYGVEVKSKLHFNSFSKVTMEVEYSGEYSSMNQEKTFYYVERDGYVFVIEDAEAKDVKGEDFKDFKKEIKEMKDDEFEVYAKAAGLKINAFKAGEGDATYKNAGAVATVVVLAVIDVALAGMAVASVLLSKKK